MKNYLIAAILTIHSFAFAAPTGVTTGSNEGVNNVVDEKAGTSRERLDRTVESIPNSKYSGSKYSGDMSRAQGGQIAQDHELSRLVSKASTIKLAELIDTRDQVFKIIETLNAINEDNEKDPVLRYANRIQAGLALATSITLGAHLNSIEKRRFLLSISAGAAVMTSLTRFYKSRANLTDHDVSKVLQRFTRQLMLNKKALTPEMQELVKEISDASD